jgi:hypothetical protein
LSTTRAQNDIFYAPTGRKTFLFSFIVTLSVSLVGRGYDLADQVTSTELSVIAESMPF